LWMRNSQTKSLENSRPGEKLLPCKSRSSINYQISDIALISPTMFLHVKSPTGFPISLKIIAWNQYIFYHLTKCGFPDWVLNIPT
jgi:hypothetical protein